MRIRQGQRRLRGWPRMGRGRHRRRDNLRAVVDTDQCVGCLVCAQVCRHNAIEEKDGIAFVNTNCTGCGACVEECPQNAISLTAAGPQEA